MTDIAELKARRDFRSAALIRLRTAYVKLVESGVKSYMIDDRQLTRFDIPVLKKEINELESEIDELNAAINGRKTRRAVGVIPRYW